jgi:CBS domain-containing protein
MIAAEIMTKPVVGVAPGATLSEAVGLMLRTGISGLPVLDGSGKLVGILTEGDLLVRKELGTAARRPRWLAALLSPGRLAGEYVHSHGSRVEELMTRDVITVAPDTPLDEIVALMTQKRVKRLPVMENDTVVGIVSRADLLKALSRSLSAKAPPSTRDDSTIRYAILDELKRESWAPIALIEVSVHNGIAELSGSIFDERERLAIQVAVENVPGVRAVRDNLVFVEPMSGMVIAPPPSTRSGVDQAIH